VGQYYQTSEEFHKIHRAFYDKASRDSILIAKMRDMDIVWRLSCFDPHSSVTIHIGDPDLAADRALSFEMDDQTPPDKQKTPQATFTMSADFNHSFWLGYEHIGNAIINGRVRASGNYIRTLAMIPAIRSIFQIFRKTLEEMGLPDLIIPSKGAGDEL
jgi:hypothetical protein